MKTVWKYILKPAISIEMLIASQLLSVNEQDGKICLWVLVDPEDMRMEVRHFRVFGTGHNIPDKQLFVGSALLEGGSLVFHVFESFQQHRKVSMQKLLGKPAKPARATLNYPGLYIAIDLCDSLDVEIFNMFVAASQRRQLAKTFKRNL